MLLLLLLLFCVCVFWVGGGARALVPMHAGRAGRSHLRFSRLTVRVEEMTAEEKARLNKFSKGVKALAHLKADPRFY